MSQPSHPQPSHPQPSYPPPPSDALNTIEHMRESVFFEDPHRRRKLQRFWMLLALSSVIAAAGVVADSTATVIGAMIVAPMMLPIQGTMLATVLGDRRNLTRSLLLMIAGAAAAIAIGWLVGMLALSPITEETNSQVAGRASPGLIDLLAALATGAVGSIALVRKDISDTLPVSRSPSRSCRRSSWSASPPSPATGAARSARSCCSPRTSRRSSAPGW